MVLASNWARCPCKSWRFYHIWDWCFSSWAECLSASPSQCTAGYPAWSIVTAIDKPAAWLSQEIWLVVSALLKNLSQWTNQISCDSQAPTISQPSQVSAEKMFDTTSLKWSTVNACQALNKYGVARRAFTCLCRGRNGSNHRGRSNRLPWWGQNEK